MNRYEPEKVRAKLTHPDAKLPAKAHVSDAGYDLSSVENTVVFPGDKKLISCGINIDIPHGWCGLIWSRSGLAAKYGLEVGAGCIDSGYLGDIKVLLYNHGKSSYVVEAGDRIAQLLLIPVMMTEFAQVDQLEDTDRGEGGFGSSGK